MFRTVRTSMPSRVDDAVLTPLGMGAIEEILEVPPVTMPSVPGFETATFPYTTDIPFLSNWGTPLLYGPGSIHVAHTDNEHVKMADLHVAVEYGNADVARVLVEMGRRRQRDGRRR